MKKTMILLLLPVLTIAQKETFMIAGFNAGYSKHITAGAMLGIRSGNVSVSANQVISLTSDATVPKIFNLNGGYNLGQVQPFISASYQTIGKEKEQLFKGTPDEFTNKFYLGYGVSYYLRNIPLYLTAQRLGKQNNIGVTMYTNL